MFAAWAKAPFQPRPSPGECDPRLASTPFAGGIRVALADGSVRQVSPAVSLDTWWAACMPDGGEVPGRDW